MTTRPNQLIRLTERFKTMLETPLVLIAGGAPRDLFHNLRFKDVDMFIGATSLTHVKTYIEKINTVYGTCVCMTPEVNEYQDYTNNIITVYNTSYRFDTTKLQLVFFRVDNPDIRIDSFRDKVLKTFDFGINQITIDASAVDGFFKNTNFLVDHDLKKFTLHHVANPQHLLKSIEKYHRLTTKKYKGYSFDYTPTCLQRPIEREFGASSISVSVRDILNSSFSV